MSEPRMVKVNDGYEVYECDARLVDATQADIMPLEERIAKLEAVVARLKDDNAVLRRYCGFE